MIRAGDEVLIFNTASGLRYPAESGRGVRRYVLIRLEFRLPFLSTDLAVLVVGATGVLGAAAVAFAAHDLGLAVVSPLALVVALVVEGSPALVSAEAAHCGFDRAVVAVVYAQAPVVAAARAPGALVPVAVLAARDEPALVAAAELDALGFVAA
jgi:hypothetical protein